MNRQLGAIAAKELFSWIRKTFDLHDIYELELVASSPYARYVTFLDFHDYPEGNAFEPFDIPVDPSEILRIVNIMRTSVRKLTQLRRISLMVPSISASMMQDDMEVPRMHAEAFFNALQYVDLPHLRQIEFYLDSRNNVLHLLKIAEATPEWWRPFATRLRKLDISQDDAEWARLNEHGNVDVEDDTRPDPAKNSCLTKLTSQMENLEELFVGFSPPQIWPVGGEAFRCLRNIWIDEVETRAEHLVAMIEQNGMNLQEWKLDGVFLLSGWWDQILVKLAQCQHIKLVGLSDCGYSRDADPQSIGFRNTNKHKDNPLHSYRWADWHAIRDVSTIADCNRPVEYYHPMVRAGVLQSNKIWDALSHQYRSLDEYRMHPDFQMEREHDRHVATTQRRMPNKQYVPQGVKAPSVYKTSQAYKRMLRSSS